MGQQEMSCLCHSRFLHLFQDSGIELRIPKDYMWLLASFLIDITSVAGPVLSVGSHMATGESESCGSSSPGSEVLIPIGVQKQSFSGHVRCPESCSFLTKEETVGQGLLPPFRLWLDELGILFSNPMHFFLGNLKNCLWLFSSLKKTSTCNKMFFFRGCSAAQVCTLEKRIRYLMSQVNDLFAARVPVYDVLKINFNV